MIYGSFLGKNNNGKFPHSVSCGGAGKKLLPDLRRPDILSPALSKIDAHKGYVIAVPQHGNVYECILHDNLQYDA